MKALYKNIFYWSLSIFLIIGVFSYGDYLVKQGYIKECFTDNGTPDTNHNVDQPINTQMSCKNMCGPLARCSITGEQCTSDVDCYGCLPKTRPEPRAKNGNIRGENDAGKLTSMEPSFSKLTTDIGTQAAVISDISKPPKYDQGEDMWSNSFNTESQMFIQRYKSPKSLVNIPDYPSRFTLSGDFPDDGPLPSNAYL
jgi:hypothetical protein